MSARAFLLCIFFLFQLAWIVTTPWHQNYFFSWAPLHESAWYTMEVHIENALHIPQTLSASEAERRYHLKTWYRNSQGWAWQSNAMEWVRLAILQEETRLKEPHSTVILKYQLNGRSETEERFVFVRGQRVE